ncbi:MAG: hypothetical protein A2846_00765 [Candidatus Doudnabacteria bacterium RIFCSPHIGHO2_01_FULL_49_9]|uniref:PrgI family protein n=1 Tax=Candidatus Doudnabacteria bacterium RIFCSPHIGHO2_01_FULL_49_9 TaxID=1817827 RepID=A0A1F5P3L9_9BACT|nr:MAG: hypothetical protein A2846_00765 [Candidatus Doudnabacteria bacterium RIFCSPHIGHO2_01_FULL_49_9]
MQYSLPQFVEVEDQILPHLTIKQFLMLIGCAVMGFIYWAIFGFSVPFVILLVLTLAIVAPIAFVKFNGRPIMSNLPGLIHYVTTPKRRIFAQAGSIAAAKKQAVVAAVEQAVAVEPPSESRLKKLAYFLDEKAAEEERLLRTGEASNKWLNEV